MCYDLAAGEEKDPITPQSEMFKNKREDVQRNGVRIQLHVGRSK